MVYVYNRLVPRVRYLHHLVKGDNWWSQEMRGLLVPRRGGVGEEREGVCY